MSRPDTPDDGGFLSRWSRLKQETKRPDPVELPAASPEEAQAVEPALSAMSEPAPEAPPLPSLDDITPGADVAAFFQKHVPEALRTAALRKLWVTDPDIKGFIEMADYQWDFNNPDSIPGWASKLENVDVKAMVDRIFNVLPDAKPASDEPPDPELPQDAAADDAPARVETARGDVRISSDFSIDSMSSHTFDGCGKTTGEADAAMRENTSESRGYSPMRKRHGSALPT
jgi:Protein of unknown function (DUF3306)